MTDHSSEPTGPPDAPDADTSPAEDALISAVLDGEATPDERELVDRDVRLRARLDSFMRVRESVSAVTPVSDAARDASIAAALDASPVIAADSSAAAPSPALLAVERARRRRQVVTVVAAAAALLIVVPLLAIALTGRGTEQDAASTGAAANESSDAITSGDAADAAPSSTTTTPSDQASRLAPQSGLVGPLFIGDLGPIGSIEQLRFDVQAALVDRSERARTEESAPSSTAGGGPLDSATSDVDASRCATAVAAADPALGLPVITSTAIWMGRPAFIAVYETTVDSPTGQPLATPRHVIVVTGADCAVIERVSA